MRLAALLVCSALIMGGCAPSKGDENAGPSDAPRGSNFDFYVLSLAWSPSYCEAEGTEANRQQCGSDRDFAFIVHGLWPQFERGYPEFCTSSEPQRVPNSLVATMLDLMPSAGLIGHQWRKHGTCTGLTQEEYLRKTRDAFNRISIPASLWSAQDADTADPGMVEALFVEANPEIDPEGIAVTCDGGLLREVRICLSKEMAFRACPQVDARACRQSEVEIPAAP